MCEIDRRPDVIRISEEEVASATHYTTEYEVECESRISGGVEIGPFLIQPWEFDEKRPGVKRLLFFKSWSRYGGIGDPVKELEHGLESGLQIEEEFVALLSVCLRRRLRLSAIVSYGGKPNRKQLDLPVHRALIEGDSNLAVFDGFFTRIKSLTPDEQRAVLLASRFYHNGLTLIDIDPQLSFLAFTSSVEALAHHYKMEQNPEEVIDAAIWEAISNHQNATDREILIKYLQENSRSTRFFIKTVTDFTENSFFVTGNAGEHCYITRDNLKSVASNIYKARSNCLHAGTPILLAGSPHDDEDLPFGLLTPRGATPEEMQSASSDPKKNPKRIPHLASYERLVNHIINQFINKPLSTRPAEPV